MFNTNTQDLTYLTTRDIAALLTAQTHGEDKTTEFVCTRLCTTEVGFHAKLKQSQCVGLKTMYTVVNVKDTTQKGKVVQADKTLFQRLLVAANAGRDLDLKTLLCHESLTVPLSYADKAKNLRPMNKAALGIILEEGVCSETLPGTELKTCTIIDGQAIGKPEI